MILSKFSKNNRSVYVNLKSFLIFMINAPVRLNEDLIKTNDLIISYADIV